MWTPCDFSSAWAAEFGVRVDTYGHLWTPFFAAVHAGLRFALESVPFTSGNGEGYARDRNDPLAWDGARAAKGPILSPGTPGKAAATGHTADTWDASLPIPPRTMKMKQQAAPHPTNG